MGLPIKDNDPSVVRQPSRRLYNAVLGAFRAQGTSYARWCDDNGISRENARAALYGVWRGPKATIILEKIVDGADREVISFLLSRPLAGQSEAAHDP